METDDIVNNDCERCFGTGVENYFFKNSRNKTIRNTQLNCTECFPDAKGTAGPLQDEVEIIAEEAYKLLDAGWRELSD